MFFSNQRLFFTCFFINIYFYFNYTVTVIAFLTPFTIFFISITILMSMANTASGCRLHLPIRHFIFTRILCIFTITAFEDFMRMRRFISSISQLSTTSYAPFCAVAFSLSISFTSFLVLFDVHLLFSFWFFLFFITKSRHMAGLCRWSEQPVRKQAVIIMFNFLYVQRKIFSMVRIFLPSLYS